MNILITGSSGLIGSEGVRRFDARGDHVTGVDGNQRAAFFGPAGDTAPNLERLRAETRHFEPLALDIRDRQGIDALFAARRFDAILHCAAQPSHDLARGRPFEDFEVNAVGTLNLLEAARKHAPEAPFVFLSSNKVYGDAPNELPMVELPTRWDYARPEDYQGIDEGCRIDRSQHSLFGVSKAAADLLVQEYGRQFGMPTCCFRAGCLTGPAHAGVELHGFLSYLVRTAVSGGCYTILGYQGKQVRDQLHAGDVIAAAEAFIEAPRTAEVYNLGGGRANSASLLECVARVEALTGRPLPTRYQDTPRRGDHICYISDLTRFRAHFPAWAPRHDLDAILEELVRAERARV